jgi:8-oxo-(d)GTP phosphatase
MKRKMPTVYLVRHAEPLPHHAWRGDDESRPLSERGRRQARRMGEILQGSGATRLICAPHARCVETAQLIGVPMKLAPIVDSKLHIARHFQIAPRDNVEIWVAHSNNIPDAIEAHGVSCHACGHASAWQLDFLPDGQVAAARCFVPDLPE